MDTLLVLAVLPAALLLFYVYKLDPVEKEPPGLLGMLLILGALSVIPAIMLEVSFDNIFLAGMNESSLFYLVIENIFGVALIEELCKFVFMHLRTWRHPAFTYVFDGIVYAVFVSLGFAIAENIMYVYEYGFGTGVMRAFTAVPGHCVFAVFMGYLYGEAKYSKARGNGAACAALMILALVVPVFCHGIYDILASIDEIWALLLFFVVLAGMVALGIMLLKLASKEQKRIYPFGVPVTRQPRQPGQPQPLQRSPYPQQPGQPYQQAVYPHQPANPQQPGQPQQPANPQQPCQPQQPQRSPYPQRSQSDEGSQ